MSALRERMVDAMHVRGLSERTIECYTEAIGRMSRHYGGYNPARLSPLQIEAYCTSSARSSSPILTYHRWTCSQACPHFELGNP